MYKPFFLLILFFSVFLAKAQQSAPGYQPYGKIDIEDLKMTSCDFEKNADAEILFDVGIMSPYQGLNFARHTRIKIFNSRGEKSASIKIFYNNQNGIAINNLQAETINLTDDKIEITQLDKKLVSTERIDGYISATVFAMPKVKPGSIIDFQYNQYFPYTWNFQSTLPTRYSEVQTSFSPREEILYLPHISQQFAKTVGLPTDNVQIKALANIPSLPDEPFMTSRQDNLQRIEIVNTFGARLSSWQKLGESLIKFNDFGEELDRNLAGEKEIIKQAKSLPANDQKIAFIFDTVKNRMKWNGMWSFAVKDGTVRAWNNKAGNSAEINLIVYDLLKKARINAYPLMVSNKLSSKLYPYAPNVFSLKNMVVYIPLDSARCYILDATNKFNLYNVIAKEQLNTFGLLMNPDSNIYKTILIKSEEPAIQSVFLDVKVKPDGKLDGTAEINSFSYNKINCTARYISDGEEKYIKFLTENDNNLKITSLKMDNMSIDTLPLTQRLNFSLEPSGSDDNYLYFNPNLLSNMHKNLFLSETRLTDIDFGYRDNFVLNGVYTLPTGYKMDALPKSVILTMPDESIIFRRTITEQDGVVHMRLSLNHKKSIYYKLGYPELYEFYKKMYEMLNEQVVLKKL